MGCISPGSADNDVAGIGILLAFGVQAFIALALAVYSVFFKPLYLSLVSREYVLDQLLVRLKSQQQSQSYREFEAFLARPLAEHFQNPFRSLDEYQRLFEGILSSSLGPSAEFIPYGSRKDRVSPQDRLQILDARERLQKQQTIIRNVLISGSDTLSITAIALLISGLTRMSTLSLYHFHVLFDVTSFTSISHCAAFSVLIEARLQNRALRFILITIFLTLYLTFTIRFGIALNTWNDLIPGHCYNPSFIAVPHASHPSNDYAYIAVTCFYLFGAFTYVIASSLSLKSSRLNSRSEKVRQRLNNLVPGTFRLVAGPKFVMTLAMAQFPVHLYFLIAIRASNEGLLEDEGGERQWGFGQILAVAMLGVNVFECVKGGREYYLWRKARKEELVREREEMRRRPRRTRSVELKRWGL